MANKVKYVKDTHFEYLFKEEYISVSDIELFLKSPRSYFYSKNNFEDQDQEMPLNVAIFEYIMNRELFDRNFIVSPKFNKRTTQGKKDYADFVQMANGKYVLTEDEMEMIIQASVGVMMNRSFLSLLEKSQYDLSVYSKDKKTGLNVKLRPHVVSDERNTLIHFMGCSDNSPKKFKLDAEEKQYGLCAAFHIDFLNLEDFVFGAIEKKPPYQTVLYRLPKQLIEHGRKQYRMGLDLLKWSIDNNYWCDYVEFEFLKEAYTKKKLKTFEPQNISTIHIKTLE